MFQEFLDSSEHLTVPSYFGRFLVYKKYHFTFSFDSLVLYGCVMCECLTYRFVEGLTLECLSYRSTTRGVIVD